VRGRQKRRLERGGRKIDPALEHALEPAGVALLVGAADLIHAGDVGHAEEEGPHGADRVDHTGDAVAVEGRLESRREERRARLDPTEEVGILLHLGEGGLSGCHGERIAGVGAGLVHGALGSDERHEIGAPTERRHR
jgi:hypothetical protein